jgi:hypothetical protein
MSFIPIFSITLRELIFSVSQCYNFEAKACNELLTAMLNHSDFDYVTVDELRRYSELSQFTFDELRTAVYELCKRGFLLVVQKPYGHVYAVNKLRISNMEFVYGA